MYVAPESKILMALAVAAGASTETTEETQPALPNMLGDCMQS